MGTRLERTVALAPGLTVVALPDRTALIRDGPDAAFSTEGTDGTLVGVSARETQA